MSMQKVKEFLEIEKEYNLNTVNVLPILHNSGLIILQMHGWSINLQSNGTWYWEATDGG